MLALFEAPGTTMSSVERRKAKGTVLVVDDDQVQRFLMRDWLEDDGYAVIECASGSECVAALADMLPDAVCLDLSMPGLSGFDTLKAIKAKHSLVPVLIFTSDTTPDSIVSAMQGGAYDYLIKPVDHTKLTTTIGNAIERFRMSMKMAELEREAGHREFAGMMGKSPVMKELYRQMDRVASSDITLLIHGESGSGKELVAKGVHANSARARGPMVAVNCAAIPESLMESELFGHEKGAFTGAASRRAGRFEEADGGTLLLDEVAELPITLQAKLLRVLQERAFRRLGGSTELKTDFRLIAATHRNLAEEVRAGRFREDLYFRIDVFEIAVPPLRERGRDVLLLAEHFLAEFAPPHAGNGLLRLDEDTVELMLEYGWPGNVRELRNAMERCAVAAAGDTVLPADLPRRIEAAVRGRKAEEAARVVRAAAATGRDAADGATRGAATIEDGAVASAVTELTSTALATPSGEAIDISEMSLEELERAALAAAIDRHSGNLSRVVEQLGIGRTTLYRKLKKYGLR